MIHRILISVALALIGAQWANADIADPPPNPREMTTAWSGPDNQFVTCAVEDDSGWWWGTDNDGLWRYMPHGPKGSRWMHIRAQDGLYDDSITALCYDRLGRLWVGTERRGVSVYNGSWWHNYDVMTGPLGVHVNAIAMNPLSGDIWIASEEGLAIYSETKKQWSYLTRADGLVSDKITCLAFSHSGTAIVGTASDGLMIGDPQANCRTWRHVVASSDAALTQIGSGLSGNLINCILVNNTGKIFCGTTTGLSESMDNGVTWSYQHGWQWTEEVNVLDQGEVTRKPKKRDYVQPPLAEEFITCLAYDKAGHLYVGHRQRGVEIYDDAKNQQLYHTPFDAHGVWIKAIVPTYANGVLIGNYTGGIALQCWEQIDTMSEQVVLAAAPRSKFPSHPTPAAAPDASAMRAMAARIASLNTDDVSSLPYYLGEDWMTQGSWVGRYGAGYTVLCAENGSTDLVLSSSPGYSVTPQLGHSTHDGEDVSHWQFWSYTGDPRVLYDPTIGTGRQAEWNDHGERYGQMPWQGPDLSYEGPDLWLTVQTPPGAQRISLYFMNKDGHTNVTRYRDYIVQLRQYVAGVSVSKAYDTPGVLPLIAQTRVTNFWPGVYESFVVNGPGKYYICIRKNHSLNTILQAVFVDRIDGGAPSSQPAWLNGVHYTPEVYAGAPTTPSNKSVVDQATALWSRLDSFYANAQSASMQRSYRILLLRAAMSGNAPAQMLASWRWDLGLWTDIDWAKFHDFMIQMRAAMPPPKKS